MRLRKLSDVSLGSADAIPDGAVLLYDRSQGRWVARVLEGTGGVEPHTHQPADIVPQGAGSGLDADLVDGYHAESFALASHTHLEATPTSPGFLSAADKAKLDTVSQGAEPNQLAYSSVVVGDTRVDATTTSDTLELAAGDNVTLTADSSQKRVTISASVSSSPSFGTVRVGSVDVVAGAPGDVLALSSGYGTTVTANASTKSVTIGWSPTWYQTVNAANVTINSTSGNTITSVSVQGGTYLILASCTFRANSSTAATLTMYLRHGSTDLATLSAGSWGSGNGPVTLTVPKVVTVAAGTLSIVATTSNASYTFTAQANTGWILALRIA